MQIGYTFHLLLWGSALLLFTGSSSLSYLIDSDDSTENRTETVAASHDAEINEDMLGEISDPGNYPENLASLVDYLAGEGFDLDTLFRDSRFEIYEGIGDRFRRSAERRSLNLEEYKGILGFQDKKSRIRDFIIEHNDQLLKAQETYDIPKYVIAAILGIESDFGKNIGSFNPFNSYVSMYAENYRAEFAKAQLKELLKFTYRNDIDVFELRSSYAGAMSFAQFIPYSINQWFVGDDIFDMDQNILSIGNYLAHFKQREGSVERAVFRYNPSQLYTDAVMSLAREAEEMFAAR